MMVFLTGDTAQPGSGSFFKIGVGALLRPAGSENTCDLGSFSGLFSVDFGLIFLRSLKRDRTESQDMFLYNITNRGDWEITKGPDFIEFVRFLGLVYAIRIL